MQERDIIIASFRALRCENNIIQLLLVINTYFKFYMVSEGKLRFRLLSLNNGQKIML